MPVIPGVLKLTDGDAAYNTMAEVAAKINAANSEDYTCLLYTSPSPRDS